MRQNEEMEEFWNGELAFQWVEKQELLDAHLAGFGRRSVAVLGSLSGARVLDVGCGYGATVLDLAEAVGPAGSVAGVDLSAPMLERAQARARELGLDRRVSFIEADAQVVDLGTERFDAVHSRFGVMFFSDPVAAFRNLRDALRVGGRLAFVCWRSAKHNPWFTVSAQATAQLLSFPEELPPRAPGPFGFAERSWIEAVLDEAGFTELEIASSDAPMEVTAPLTISSTSSSLSGLWADRFARRR